MNIFEGESVNRLVFKAMSAIRNKGAVNTSRNGEVKFITDAEFILNDPRRRHLSLEGRKSNIFQMIAETLWVIAGKDELYPYLSHFLPRAPFYSDDGKTWRGAYGPRMYAFNQLQGAVDAFIADGIDTRRVTVMIHDPKKDAPSQLAKTQPLGTRDTPCNLMFSFYVDEQKRFTMRTIQRSGDIVFGAGSINLFEFSFIQEMMHSVLSQAMGQYRNNVSLGPYRHTTFNLHVYEALYGQVDNVLGSRINVHEANGVEKVNRGPWPLGSMYFPPSINQCRSLAVKFIDEICCPLLAAKFSCDHAVSKLWDLFAEYQLEKPNQNLLYTYMELVLIYIASTRKINPQEGLAFDGVYALPDELYNALASSSFRKFDLPAK